MNPFIAHIRIHSDGTETKQTVAEHCASVSRYCSETLAPLGLAKTGALLGLLHDMGKQTAQWQEYLRRSVNGESVQRGSANHTFAAVRLLLERYHDTSDPSQLLACEILASCCGSHHGLFDGVAPDGSSGFIHRMQADIPYIEAISNFFTYCIEPPVLDSYFHAAALEIAAFLPKIQSYCRSQEECFFGTSLLTRLLLSSLIDADRRDTAEFMLETALPHCNDPASVWTFCLRSLKQKINDFPTDTPINRARRCFSDQCAAFDKSHPGTYRLSLPTGGGKTLSGLLAALSHAEKHGKSRIFFLIPLLSVLEQNAQVIRDALNADEWILEHHSNVLKDNPDSETLNANELLTENWQAPIIITTLVQFLNTLFHGKTSCIRRMQGLINSVIVIDEVQSVPRHMLSLFNQAVNFLTEVCGCTVILCSATQPCLEQTEHPLYSPRDMIPYDETLWRPFRRTKIIDLCSPYGKTSEELSSLILHESERAGSVLIICNKKAEVEELYQQLKDSPIQTFCLSTSMCMEHRRSILQRLSLLLKSNMPVVCLSTCIVEAGVDFSFGCVIRLLAGMDNVIQAAGRCNRHNEKGQLSPVYITNWRNEQLNYLSEIQSAKDASQELLNAFSTDPSNFGGDLQSPSAIRFYYHRLYSCMAKNAQDFWIRKHNASLFQMLSCNSSFRRKCSDSDTYLLGQAFKTAGESFRVFDDQTVDVLVPYKNGTELITKFCSEKAKQDLTYRKQLLAESKGYTVSLFEYQLNELWQKGGIFSCCNDSVLAVLPEFYSNDRGLVLNNAVQPLLLG